MRVFGIMEFPIPTAYTSEINIPSDFLHHVEKLTIHEASVPCSVKYNSSLPSSSGMLSAKERNPSLETNDEAATAFVVFCAATCVAKKRDDTVYMLVGHNRRLFRGRKAILDPEPGVFQCCTHQRPALS